MSQTKRIVTLFLLLFILCLVISPHGFTSAKAEVPLLQKYDGLSACYSLDIIFLIDQSGSMQGFGGAPASDPNNNRKFAVDSIIDLLADIATDQCPEAYHRIAVISYGSEAQVDLDLSNFNPQDFQEAQDIREELKKSVKLSDLGQTNPKLAFLSASEILNDASIPPEGGPRKKVIVFITDGIPYPAASGGVPYAKEMKEWVDQNFPFDTDLLKQEQCLAGLWKKYKKATEFPSDKLNECLLINKDQNAYQRSTYLWMILLKSSQAYPRNLLEIYKDIAERHAGELIELPTNLKEIPKTFRDIVSKLAGVQAQLISCGQFAVNPYLKRATLTIFKINPELNVTLSYTDMDGKTHSISGGESNELEMFDVGEYYKYGANERYVLNYPYPGLWNLTADNCEGLDAYYEGVEISPGNYSFSLPSQIPEYDREPYFDSEKPYFLEYQMIDDAGRIIEQADHEEFAVEIDMKVTQPDGTEVSYPMEWKPAEKLFRSKEALNIPLDGVYSIAVSGETNIHEGEISPITSNSYSEVFNGSRPLFEQDGSEFKVFPVTPFVLEITYPAQGENLSPVHGTLRDGWPLPVSPITVTARIVDEQDQPFTDLGEVLTDPDNALMATLISPGENPHTLKLIADPTVPGVYHGEFVNIESIGNHSLMVDLQTDYTDHFRPLNRQSKIDFSRSDGPWNQVRTYYYLAAFLLTIIFLIILYNIIIRTNKVRGNLIFTFNDGSEAAVFSINSGVNWKKIGSKALNAYPILDLKKIRVSNIGRATRKSKESVSDDMFVGMDGVPSTGHPGVRVVMTTKSGAKFTENLQPGYSVPYSAFGTDNAMQLEYKPNNE